MRGTLVISAACLALAAAGARTVHAQNFYLSAYTTCAITSSNPDSNYVIWTTYDVNSDPYAFPDWVGYDVMRRTLPGCDPEVRVNEEIVPRQVGMTHTRYFGTVAPSGGLYEYRVVPVDADHQLVFIGGGFCSPCNAFVTCPQFSTPMTIGTLTDLGWALLITPCQCYPGAYFEGPHADELRPYAGTSTTIRFFGTMNCGTVEGCALDIDHWELAPTCGVTPTARDSWGRLKTIYR